MLKLNKVAIVRGDKYLILKRSPNAVRFPNLWDFPGGRLEPDEKPEDGAIREVKEETTIDVKIIKKLGAYEFDFDNLGKTSHQFSVYESEVIGDDEVVLSSEHSEYRWLTKEDVLKLQIQFFMVEFFKEF
jgi:8-oxo-dGTP diphosphatase